MLQQFLTTRPDLMPLTARDLFEGSAGGEAVYLFSKDAYEEGVHPLSEVVDLWTADDNGLVCVDLGRGPVALDPDTELLAADAWREEPRRRLPSRVDPPDRVDLAAAGDLAHVAACRSGGELGCMRWGGLWLCVWRRDGRGTRSLPVVSAHGTEAYVRQGIRTAEWSFEAPKAPRSRRVRDDQRERVYRWEGSFGMRSEPLAGIEAVRALVERVCDDLGCPPPTVAAGRATLESCSYYRGGTIVMAASMLERSTALHETAHHLADRALRRSRERQASHGPMFCGILAGLYVAYAHADLDEAGRQAEARGVVWDRRAAEWVIEKAWRPQATAGPRRG